jgi:hypothetical protein
MVSGATGSSKDGDVEFFAVGRVRIAESVASKQLAIREAQWQIDQKVALEWTGLEDVGPSTIQL